MGARMPSKKVAMAHRWFQEVWVHGNDAVIEELFAKGCVLHHHGQGEIYRGPTGFRRLYREVNAVLEDIRCDFHQTIEQGDTIAIRWTFSGLPKLPAGSTARRRKRMKLWAVTIFRISGGQFIEVWDTYDAAPLEKVGASGIRSTKAS